MFTPEELEFMPRAIEKLYSDLEWRIMSDIIRRIAINGEVTRAADWQIYRLHELGESKEAIKSAIQDALNLTDKEIDQLYEDAIASGYTRDHKLYEAAGKEFISYAENKVLQQMVKAIKEQTFDAFKNITQSLGFAEKVNGKIVFTDLAEFYQQTLDAAMVDIASGTFDYNTVLKRTIDTLTNSGLRTVDYASGWSNRVEVAARRAIMTGVTQITGKINEQNAEKLETEYFEVSWHADARPTHQEWQGRVYSKKDLEEVCGLGTGDGLAGWNCRHTYYPFIPGISERLYTDEQLEAMNEKENTPKEWNGKKYTSYEASQKQRKMETSIRAWKRKIKLLQEGGASDDVITAAKCRYRTLMDEYARFSEAMKMPQQKERFYIGKAAKAKKGLAAGKSDSNGIPAHKAPKQRGTVDIRDKKAVQLVLERCEAEILSDTIENAIVITSKGEIIQCYGSLNGVYPDTDLGDELKDAIMTHNHPVGSNNEYSFSDDDVELFIQYGLSKLRGIDEKYIYELTRNAGDIDEHMSLFEIMQSEDSARHEKMIDIAYRNGLGYRRWKRE